MKNLKKLILMLLVLSLTLCMALTLVSCGGEEEPTDPDENESNTPSEDDGKITYTVTVKDSSGNLVSGASVELLFEGVAPVGSAVTTGADGIATFKVKNEGEYYAKVTKAPAEYDLSDFPKAKLVNNAATVTIQKLPVYTVYVKDASGNPIKDVRVQLCDATGACQLPKPTDAEGKIESALKPDIYQAKIVSAPAGYVYTSDYFTLTNNTVTIILVSE